MGLVGDLSGPMSGEMPLIEVMTLPGIVVEPVDPYPIPPVEGLEVVEISAEIEVVHAAISGVQERQRVLSKERTALTNRSVALKIELANRAISAVEED